MKKKKNYGFTLAEVLITLTIIGVVAALTLPSVIQNTRKKEMSVALRKRYAELTQVIGLSALNNGNSTRWDWSLEYKDFVNKYFAPYIKISECKDCWATETAYRGLFFEQAAFAAPSPDAFDLSIEQQTTCYTGGEVNPETAMGPWGSDVCPEVMAACKNGATEFYPSDFSVSIDADLCQAYLNGDFSEIKPADKPEITYSLPDGSLLGFYKKSNSAVLYIYLDVNGKKAPNRFGVDRYLLMLSGSTISLYGDGESDLRNGKYGCSGEGNGFYCGALLKANNWEYPENYLK